MDNGKSAVLLGMKDRNSTSSSSGRTNSRTSSRKTPASPKAAFTSATQDGVADQTPPGSLPRSNFRDGEPDADVKEFYAMLEMTPSGPKKTPSNGRGYGSFNNRNEDMFNVLPTGAPIEGSYARTVRSTAIHGEISRAGTPSSLAMQQLAVDPHQMLQERDPEDTREHESQTTEMSFDDQHRSVDNPYWQDRQPAVLTVLRQSVAEKDRDQASAHAETLDRRSLSVSEFDDLVAEETELEQFYEDLDITEYDDIAIPSRTSAEVHVVVLFYWAQLMLLAILPKKEVKGTTGSKRRQEEPLRGSSAKRHKDGKASSATTSRKRPATNKSSDTAAYSSEMQKRIDVAKGFLKLFCAQLNPFATGTERREMVLKAITAANDNTTGKDVKLDLRRYPYIYWAVDDAAQWLRSKVRERAMKIVPSQWHDVLGLSPDRVKASITRLLEQGNCVQKEFDPNDPASVPTGAFKHPAIALILTSSFCGMSCESIEDDSVESNMFDPAAMPTIAFVCTYIHHALEQYCTGSLRTFQASFEVEKTNYEMYMGFLKRYRLIRAGKFEDMKEDLRDNFRGAITLRQAKALEKGLYGHMPDGSVLGSLLIFKRYTFETYRDNWIGQDKAVYSRLHCAAAGCLLEAWQTRVLQLGSSLRLLDHRHNSECSRPPLQRQKAAVVHPPSVHLGAMDRYDNAAVTSTRKREVLNNLRATGIEVPSANTFDDERTNGRTAALANAEGDCRENFDTIECERAMGTDAQADLRTPDS
ncbi:hypothetical protein CALCODRAFT_513544, partial [Calocera cornea HHB12733]